MRIALLTLVTVAVLAGPLAAKENKNGVTAFVFINGTAALAITVSLNGGEIGTLEPGELLAVPVGAGIHLIEAEAQVGEQTVFRDALCEAVEGVATIVALDEESEEDPTTFSITCPEPEEFDSVAVGREVTIALLACCGLCLVYGSATVLARRG